VQSAELVPAKSLVIDGEMTVPRANGIADYQLFLSALGRGGSQAMIYQAFDLLHWDGFDLRDVPLAERKRALEELLAAYSAACARKRRAPVISYVEHFDESGRALFRKACEMGLEGLVAKKRDSRYRSGRSPDWVKVKCAKSGTYPIIAFVEKLGANPRRIASLYIGQHRKGKLLYGGKVQSGYSREIARAVREKLDPYIRKTSPLDVPVKKPKATWVEPMVGAEVSYSAVTGDGLLRSPVFKGLREDLEDAAPPPARPRPVLVRSRDAGEDHARPGVPRENILQLLPDAVAPSKEELARYWRRVGKGALEHLGNRPLKLVRNVHGTVFYHKGPLPPVPDSVHQLRIEKREGGEGVRVWVDDVAGLLGLVEMDAVELHPWNATVEDIEHADRLVFDLDPGEGVAWSFVTDTALRLRDLLEAEGFETWPKVTGGKGLHIMAPLESRITHDRAHHLSRRLAQRLADTDPARYTITAAMVARRGRLFIDYLRNGRGTTAVGAYSPRARPTFPIAAPVTWKQVEDGIRPDAYTLAKPPRARGS
jgi:bifunctional non-homologous end joining protein LigD